MELSCVSSNTESEPKSVTVAENRMLPLVETFIGAAENTVFNAISVVPNGKYIRLEKQISLPKPQPVFIPEAKIYKVHPERKWAENISPIKKQLRAARKKDLLICDRCGEFFKNTTNLKMHQRRHTGIKDFACTSCSQRFVNSYLLKVHERVRHLGEQPYACKFCEKRFFTCTARGQHERVRHIPDRKYECDECGYMFKTKTDLNRHKYLHTGKKPFRCDVCNVNFSRRHYLKHHYDTSSHQRKATSVVDAQQALIMDDD